MIVAPKVLVFMLLSLHLQCLYTKYYLVETDGEAARVHKKHGGSPKHVVSLHKTSKIKTKTGNAKRRKKALSHPSTSGGTRKSMKSKYYSGSHRNHGKHPNQNYAEFGIDYNDNYVSPDYPGNHEIPEIPGRHGNHPDPTGINVYPGNHVNPGGHVNPRGHVNPGGHINPGGH